MKGQSAFELLVTVGVIIGFSIPIVFLLLSATSIGYENTAKAQADSAARILADNVGDVYSQGYLDGIGAQRELLLSVPASTYDINVNSSGNGSEVVIRLHTSNGIYEAAAPSFAVIQPPGSDIQNLSGLLEINITDVNGNVSVGSYG